mgnify:CR=1 FL=1
MNEESSKLSLGLGAAGVRISPGEFDAAMDYDSSYRYELLEGRLVVRSIAGEAEAEPNRYLGRLLWAWHREHPQGGLLDLTLADRVIHFPESRRVADRVLWAGLGRRPDPAVDPPTIAIDFVQAERRGFLADYEERRRAYAELGVAEYWLVDRFRPGMYVSPRGGETVFVAENETYATELLPGFELPLPELLVLADSWEVPPENPQ